MLNDGAIAHPMPEELPMFAHLSPSKLHRILRCASTLLQNFCYDASGDLAATSATGAMLVHCQNSAAAVAMEASRLWPLMALRLRSADLALTGVTHCEMPGSPAMALQEAAL